MKIAVASGKGGVGKTTVSLNLAASMAISGIPVRVLDCDVEEPDGHLYLLDDECGLEERSFVGIPVPEIDLDKCTACGKCSTFCQYHALAVIPGNVLVFPELCHGCGGCSLVCPEGAITEVSRKVGTVSSVSDTAESLRPGPAGDACSSGSLEYFRGLLEIGEAMPTPVIRELKKYVADSTVANDDGIERHTILDAPPGSSCAVIETITDADYCLLVSEPTPFGVHDIGTVYEITKHLGVPCGMVINRDGIGDDSLERFCSDNGIPVLMRIPSDMKIAGQGSRGELICASTDAESSKYWQDKFMKLFEAIAFQVKSKRGEGHE